MKIGLDLYFKQKNGAGINNYVGGVFGNLLEMDKDNEYFAIGEEQFDLPLKSCHNIAMTMDYTNRYDFMAYIHRLDIIHSAFYPFYGLKSPCKKILTIHDLIPLVYKKEGWGAYSAEYYEGPICRSAREADAVVAVSEHTKRDIITYFGVEPDKVHVIYNGLNKSAFKKATDSKNNAYYAGDYFLSVSTMGPYKNFKGLIEAFVMFKNRHESSNIKLILTGKVGWDGLVGLNIRGVERYKEDIIFTGYVSDEELYYLYRDAVAFIFPSFYEGFGIPVLEAMALGKAVISSDAASLPEIGGNAVEYCNPKEVESITAAMENVYFNDDRRTELEKLSIAQADKFSYKKNAEELLQLYHNVLEAK